ncbi:MAG: radical SAM protein [Pseudonocardiaceae bacterium]
MGDKLPVLTDARRAGLRPELQDVIEYRKSGLSLNHVIGCPLDCAYCVRHLFDNYKMKTPRALMSDEDAVSMLVGHRCFQPHVTPVQVFNRATAPMLPAVKPHTFNVLRLLDERELTNHVLVITRWRVELEDCETLNSYRHIRATLLVTHSGIADERIEPVDSEIAARSLATAYAHAGRYRVILYWRPIVPGINDSDADLSRAREMAEFAHATVFTGLFFRNAIRDYYRSVGLPEPYEATARRKIFPEDLERRILAAFRRDDGTYGPLFRKTSCAVCYVHGLPDYNGHYGIRELCDICPVSQLRLCAAAWRRPGPAAVASMAADLGGNLVDINDRAIVVAGLDEPTRYLMQHTFGYQVHDVAKPHHHCRHGRADVGWPAPEGATP